MNFKGRKKEGQARGFTPLGLSFARLLLPLALLVCPLAPISAGPVFQAAGTAAAGTGAVSPAWPAHQAGDIGLLFVESAGGEAVTLSVPNGFSLVGSYATGAGIAGTRITVFWARAGSSGMAAPTVQDPGDHVYAVILTFRGAVRKTGVEPWDVTGGGVKASPTTSLSAAGVTTGVEDTLLVLGVANDLDSNKAWVSNWVNSGLTGITEWFDAANQSGNGGGLAVMTGTSTAAGATGTTTVTMTSSINAYINIALKRLTAPAINSLTPAATSISAGWPLITGATGYVLVAATEAGIPPALTLFSETAVNSSTVTGLSANTTYYIYSRSNGESESSEWKFLRATATLVQFPPSTPSFPAVSTGSARFDWEYNGNPLNGNFYRVSISTASDPLLPGGAAVTAYETYGTFVSTAGLAANTTYYFKVAGINHNNVPTSYLEASTATLALQPAFGSFLSVDNAAISLSWSSANPGVTRYRVKSSTAANWLNPGGAAVVSSDTYSVSLASSGLAANTTYYFWVAAVNPGGVETEYFSVSTVTLANVPSLPSFAAPSAGGLVLSWNSNGNPGGTLYRVLASTVADFAPPAAISSADTYSQSLSTYGLAANTTYYFRAYAVNRGGVQTAAYLSASTSTLALMPVFDAFQGITDSAITFKLRPDNPGNPLYRIVTLTAPEGAPVTSSDTYNLELSSSGLAVNTTYYFRAAARNHNGVWTDLSPAQGAVTLAKFPAFSAFAVPSPGEITLSWTDNGNPPGTLYRVAVSTSETPVTPGYAAATSSDTYGFSLSTAGLRGNTTYYFSMAGVNRAGSVSAYGLVYSTATRAAPPSSFSFDGVSSHSLRLSWTDPGNGPGTRYIVKVATADPDTPGGAVVTSSETYNLYVTTSGLAHTKEYFFRAAAVNNGGLVTAYINAGSTTTLAPGVLSAPLAGAYEPHVSSMTAAWTFVSGADSYTLAASVNPGTEPSPLLVSSDTLTGTELSASVEGLTADSVYYLFVRANGSGDPSAWAPYPAAATLLAAAPTLPEFSGLGTNSVNFGWTDAVNAFPGTRYRVVSSTADPLAPAGAVVGSSYTYNLSLSSAGLTPNTTYHFRVAGVNKDGVFTGYTAVKDTVTLTAMPVFTSFTSVGTGAIRFNWNINGNPPGTLYRVETLLAEAGPAVTSSDTYNNYLSSSGLSANTTYYFRVAGLNHAGGRTEFTAVRSTATLAAAPSFLDFSGVTASAASFAWTAPDNPPNTLYRVLSSSVSNPQPGGTAVISSDTYNFSLSSSGLTSDRAYYFRAAAVNHNGVVTDYTESRSTYTLTFAPQFSSFTVQAAGAIRFDWGPGGNPAGTRYRVETLLSEAGPAVTSSDTYNTWLSSSGLAANATYYFRVAGVNGGGSPTGYTSARGTSTLANMPGSSPFTEVWASSVQFNWTQGNNPAGTLYRAQTLLSEGGAAVTSSDTYNTWLSSAGLGGNTTYYFRVAAVNNNGVESGYTVVAGTSTLALIPVFDAFANVTSSRIQFKWTADNPAGTLYRVLSSTAADPEAPGGAAVRTDETYDKSVYPAALLPQTTYNFRAAAINNNGIITQYSAPRSTVTLPSSAATLYFRTAGSPLGGNAKLLSRARGPAPATYAKATVAGTVTPPTVETQFTIASGGSTVMWYSYPLGEITIASDVTFNIWAMEDDRKANSTVTAVLYRADVNGTILSPPIASAVLSRAELGTTMSPPQSWAKTPALTSLDNGDRLAVAWYIDDAGADTMLSGYTVSASLDGAAAGVSGDSWVQIEETLIPAHPDTVSVPASAETSLTGAWSLVEGATGYTLAASLSAANPPVSVAASSTTLGDASAVLGTPPLNPNTTYYMFVKANALGGSSYWEALPATATLAAQPSFLAFNSVSENAIALEWNSANPGDTLYRVVSSTAQDWLAPGGAAVVSSYTYNTTLSSSGLAHNTTYYFWIAAANRNGGFSGYTLRESTATRAAAPASASFASASESSITLGWTSANPPGTQYRVISSTASNWLAPGGAAVVSSYTYSDTLSTAGLAYNTTYYFWVAAVNRGGIVTADLAVSTATRAAMPSFTAFSAVSENTASFAWTSANPPGTQYRVISSTASNWLIPGGAAVVSSYTYNDTLSSSGLAYNTTYYFWIAAVNRGGIPTADLAVSTVTRAAMPSFTGFSAVSENAASFGWTSANPPGTQYRVISSTAWNWESPGGAAVVSSYTYSDTLSSAGLAYNTTYYFWVAALNRSGTPSAELAVSTATRASMPSFNGFSAVSEDTASFGWSSANPPGTQYRVISSTASNWLSPGGAAVVSSYTYSDTLSSSGLAYNTTHYFWIAAVNRGGIATAELAVSTATRAAAPASGSFTAVSQDAIALEWTSANPGDTLYRVVSSTASNWLSPGGAAVVSSYTYNETLSTAGLAYNTTYYFWIAAVNRGGIHTAYSVELDTSTLAMPPSHTSFEFTGVSSYSVRAGWSNPGNGPGVLYRVQVSTAADMDFLNGAVVTSSDTYDLYITTSGLVYSTEYYFRAAAVNNNGIMTAYSAAASTTTLEEGKLSAPLAGASVPYVSSMTAAWTQVAGALGYTLAASVNPGTEPSPIAFSSDTLTGTELSAYVEGLAPDTVYYLFVRANGSGTPSVWASYPAAATLLAAAPTSPAFSALGDNAVSFGWTDSVNAPGTRYRVVSSTATDPLNPGGAVAVSSLTYNLALSSAGLAYNTTYYFRVAGVNKDGAATDYTAAQSTATQPALPVFSSFTVASAGGVQFNWSRNGNPSDTLYRAETLLSEAGEPASSSDTYNAWLSSSGLAANTTYYFRVAAVNRAGEVRPYTELKATSTLADLPVFAGFSEVWASSAGVSWNKGNNPDGTAYRVLVSTTANPQPGGAAVSSSDTYNLDLTSSGLIYNTTYYFRVAGINHNGVAGSYFTAESTPTLAGSPVFSGFTDPAQSAMRFNWAPAGNPGGTLYRVWTSTAADPLEPGAAAATSSDTYNNFLSSAGLAANTTYYFRAAAVSHAGLVSTYSAVAATATFAEAPVFTAFTEVSSYTARFGWSAPLNPPGTLYRAQLLASPSGEPLSSSDTYNAWFMPSGLSSDTTYYFRAFALNHNGAATGFTDTVSTRTLTAPPLFTEFTAVYASSAQFNWSRNGAPAGTLYRVLASTAPDPSQPLGAAVSSSDTYNNYLSTAGLGSDTLYHFRISGINGSGSPTAFATPQSTRTLAHIPITPGFAEVWASSVQFNWGRGSNPAGVTLYRVLSSTAPDPLSPSGATVASSDTYNTFLSTTGLGLNATYYFRVAGVNSAGTPSAYTAPADTATLANIPVFQSFSNVGSSKLQFNWTSNGNPAGTLYRVVSSTALNPLAPLGAAVRTEETYGNYLFQTGLLSATTYYFRAAAVSHNGVATEYSLAQSTVTQVSVASTLYFLDTAFSLDPNSRLMTRGRGAAPATYTKTTMLGPVAPPNTITQFTPYGGGPVVAWYSHPLDEVTIAGGVTFNLWAMESNKAANASLTAVLYRAGPSGVLISTIAAAAAGRPELDFSNPTVQNWAVTTTPTTLASGDRLAVAWYLDDAPAVTMAADYTISASLNGATPAASGDSWVQVEETLAPARPTGVYVSTLSETSVTGNWSLVQGATGYTLIASTESRNPPALIAASSTTLVDSSATVNTPALTPNTTYHLFVHTNGPGASSVWVALPATATLANIPVFDAFSEVSATSIKFAWTDNGNPGNTLYRVLVSTAADPKEPGGAAVTAHETYGLNITTSGLAVGAFYNFRVAAINHNRRFTNYTVAKGTPTLAVYINEVYPSGGLDEDWAEIYNNTGNTISLAGWKLDYMQDTLAASPAPSPLNLWTGQAGNTVLPHSTFSITGFTGDWRDLNSAAAHHVRLVDSYGGLMDRVQWPALAAGQSFARVYDGNPSYFEIDPTPTPGYFNAVGTDTVRINEVAYGPLAGQFIEIYNTSPVSTVSLGGYALRNKAASAAGLVFRFTRKVYPQSYTLIHSSSVGDDGKTFAEVFGAGGLAASGDFLALENSAGSVVDAVAWQSAGNYPRYGNGGAALPLADYAPSTAAATSVARQPAEGADTGSDSADFTASAVTTLGSRNNGAGGALGNDLYYPADDSQPKVLSRRFPLRLKFGETSSAGQADTLIFLLTGGAPDAHSPHIYRLADLGFDLADSLAQQATAQYGPAFFDQDGYPLVSSSSYRLIFNSDTGSTSAEQVIIDTVTYDASVHSVTGSTAAPVRMNNASRAAVLKIEVSNNSPAGFNTVALATVAFSLLDQDLAALPLPQVQNLFNALMLVRDSTSGLTGVYEPGIDLSTVAYVSMGDISVDGNGLSTFTVAAQYLPDAYVAAGSTRAFFVVLESTRDASAWGTVFRAGFNAAAGVMIDATGELAQDFTPSAQVYTSSVTLIAQAQAPANTSWPYVTPSSAPINTLSVSYFGGAAGIGLRSYVASTDGYVRALSTGGALLWEFPTSPLSPINSNPSDPQVEGGLLFIYFAADNGDVYKLQDLGGDRSVYWSSSTQVQVGSDIVISGSRLFFGGSDGRMHCLQMADGAGCGWADITLGGTVSGTPLVDERGGINSAWVGTENGRLVQFRTDDGYSGNDLTTGLAIRSSPFGDTAWIDSTQKLYITSTDNKLYTATLNLAEVEAVFDAGEPIHTSPFLWTFGGTRYVFFGDDGGRLHKVSTRTWTEETGVWPFQAGGAIRSGPVVVPYDPDYGPADLQSYLYFGADDGYIYAVNINTGELRPGWPVATGGPVRADPVADPYEKTLTVGSNDGRTYVLNIGP